MYVHVYTSHKKWTLFTPHSTVHLPYNTALCVSCTEIVVLTCTLMWCLQLHSLFVGHSCITSHDQEFCDSIHSSVTFTCMWKVYYIYMYMYMYVIIHVHAIQPVRIGLHTFHSCTSSITYMYTLSALGWHRKQPRVYTVSHNYTRTCVYVQLHEFHDPNGLI